MSRSLESYNYLHITALNLNLWCHVFFFFFSSAEIQPIKICSQQFFKLLLNTLYLINLRWPIWSRITFFPPTQTVHTCCSLSPQWSTIYWLSVVTETEPAPLCSSVFLWSERNTIFNCHAVFLGWKINMSNLHKLKLIHLSVKLCQNAAFIVHFRKTKMFFPKEKHNNKLNTVLLPCHTVMRRMSSQEPICPC